MADIALVGRMHTEKGLSKARSEVVKQISGKLTATVRKVKETVAQCVAAANGITNQIQKLEEEDRIYGTIIPILEAKQREIWETGGQGRDARHQAIENSINDLKSKFKEYVKHLDAASKAITNYDARELKGLRTEVVEVKRELGVLHRLEALAKATSEQDAPLNVDVALSLIDEAIKIQEQISKYSNYFARWEQLKQKAIDSHKKYEELLTNLARTHNIDLQ